MELKKESMMTSQIRDFESATAAPLFGEESQQACVTSTLSQANKISHPSPEEDAARAIYEARQIYLAMCFL